jgi:V/A-type H+-transporting ATPase subunit G/H
MALALLKEISAVEQQAEQLEAEALQKAREIVAAAKKDASAALLKAEEQAEQEAKEILRASEEKAAKDIQNKREEIRKQCLEIKDLSGRKLDNAVDFIVGRIVTHSDR